MTNDITENFVWISYQTFEFNLSTTRENAFYDELNIFNNVIWSYHQMARESEHYRHENVLLIKNCDCTKVFYITTKKNVRESDIN